MVWLHNPMSENHQKTNIYIQFYIFLAMTNEYIQCFAWNSTNEI